MTDDLYQTIKTNYLKRQNPIVRSHVKEFFRWLKTLDALDVYDALEKGETVKDKYDRMSFNPIRITVAAGRGLLKASKNLREKANRAIDLEIARLVIRFENPNVYQVLKQFDQEEKFLRDNIKGTKEILGLVEAAQK